MELFGVKKRICILYNNSISLLKTEVKLFSLSPPHKEIISNALSVKISLFNIILTSSNSEKKLKISTSISDAFFNYYIQLND